MFRISLSLILLFSSCSVVPSSNPIGFGQSPLFPDIVPASDYVIYSDEATLPTLYISINMLTHNKPSYFWMGRAGTIDVSKLPSHVTSLASDVVLRAKIAEINAANPKATFTFYMNDMRIAKLQILFYSQGIDASRVKAVMLSDGTGTYNEFAKVFGGSGAFSKWNSMKSDFKTKMGQSAPLGDPNEFFGGAFCRRLPCSP